MAYIPPNPNGQATGANSAPVVVASDQSPLYTYLTSPSQVALGLVAKVTPGGALQTEGGLTTLLSDTFDTALDTTNKWSVSGTTLPASTGGSVIASLGATNSVSSVLISQPSFTPEGQSQLLAGQIKLGSQQTNPNAHTFFGTGSVTSYAAATPLTNGFGFERDITGALNCVVYINGTRYVANSTNPALITSAGSWAADMVLSNYGTNLTWPASGTAIVLMRYFAGLVYFYMAGASNGLDVPVAIASYKPGAVNNPVRFASITTPAVSTVLATTSELSGFILGSIDGTDINIADPNYPWRQAAVTVTTPAATDGAMAVRQIPDDIFRVSFADAYTGAVAPEFTLLQTGTGMAVNQTGGNLVITSGTTANSETMIRSVRSFKGAMALRYKTILSQRIVQNNFIVELADLIQDAATYVINSATSVTVTFTTNPFTSINVGQFCNLGVITGAAGIPGRYAIASVSGLTVTFTVAAWPGSGSGTLTVYGWNYLRANYNGTTATAVGFDTQRKGWNTGDSVLAVNTTASPGHMGHIQTDNVYADFNDSLVASSTAPTFTSRGSRLENIPQDDTVLYLFIRALNGTTNPATTTTWTVGFVSVEQHGNQKVFIAGGGPGNAATRAIPVTGQGGFLSLITTLTTLTGTTSLTPGVAAANLGKAEDAVAASGDVGVAMLGVRTDISATQTSGDGDYGTIAIDLKGQPFVVPGRCSTANLANVASSATSVTLQAASTSRKGLIIYNDSTATLFLKYGATASATSFTYFLAAGATWEMPSPLFTGIIDGIWASANGNARVTELVG